MKTQFEINFNNKTILFKKLKKNINNYITIEYLQSKKRKKNRIFRLLNFKNTKSVHPSS